MASGADNDAEAECRSKALKSEDTPELHSTDADGAVLKEVRRINFILTWGAVWAIMNGIMGLLFLYIAPVDSWLSCPNVDALVRICPVTSSIYVANLLPARSWVVERYGETFYRVISYEQVMSVTFIYGGSALWLAMLFGASDSLPGFAVVSAIICRLLLVHVVAAVLDGFVMCCLHIHFVTGLQVMKDFKWMAGFATGTLAAALLINISVGPCLLFCTVLAAATAILYGECSLVLRLWLRGHPFPPATMAMLHLKVAEANARR
eukprot:jgi/Botrbrau1/17405/Bobra.0054s0002.1